MGAEMSTLETWRALRAMFDRLDELAHLIQEDAPYPHSFADGYGGAAANLQGWMSSALDAAHAANVAARQADYQNSVEALAKCTEYFQRAANIYYNELVSFPALEDLSRLAREHPQEWGGWTASIKATLNQCDPQAVYEALVRCLLDYAILGTAVAVRYVPGVRPAAYGAPAGSYEEPEENEAHPRGG